MTDIAIRVDNLSKLYHINALHERHDTLRDALVARFQHTRQHTNPVATNSADTELWALRDVSLEVKRGEVVGIIGHNGAGKSTLLKILSRITEPTSGRAELYGRVGSLLEVGTGFHPELTGRENIYLNGAILGMRRVEIDRKFDQIAAFAETERFLDTPVKRYSSGMYVRLAFAVAAYLEPEILLVDEVLAVGDAGFQKKSLRKMKDLASENRCVIMVSHSLNHISAFCDRVMWLDNGSVHQIGNTPDVIRDYEGSIFGNSTALSINKAKGSGTVQIVAVTLLNLHGQPAQVFEPSGSMTVRVFYQKAPEVSDLAISIGVVRDDTLHCYTTFSDESGFPLPNDNSAVIEAHYDSLHLLPGSYNAYITARSSQEKSLVYDYRTTSFQIESHEELEFRHGSFFNPVRWGQRAKGR